MINSLKNMLGFGPSVDYKQLLQNGAKIIDVRTRGEYAITEFPESPTGGWVHVSFTSTPRRQAFVTHDGKNYTLAA